MVINQIASLKMGTKFKKTSIGEIPVEWEALVLKDLVGSFLNGGTPDTKNQDFWKGTIPWITGADFLDQTIGQVRRYISEEAVKQSATNVIPKGALLAVTRTGVGKLAIAPYDIAISQDITALIANEKTSAGFLYWVLNYFMAKLGTSKQGTSINGILRKDLEILPIALPPPGEQKKIAEILSSVDDAIGKADAVIAKTQDLKKGLMQRLLTRGIGHTKFKKTPIGQIPVKWEAEKLGHLCRGGPEYGANASAIQYLEDLPRYVRITDVLENGFLTQVDKKSISRELAAGYFLEEGDFLFARSGATVGKTYLYRKSDGECAFAGYMIRFRPDRKKLSSEFLFQVTHSDFYYQWVKGMLRAGAQPNINGSEYSKFLLPTPPIDEQNKIVEILSSVDAAIEKAKSELDHLEQTKKSLMADLLTGRLRV